LHGTQLHRSVPRSWSLHKLGPFLSIFHFNRPNFYDLVRTSPHFSPCAPLFFPWSACNKVLVFLSFCDVFFVSSVRVFYFFPRVLASTPRPLLCFVPDPQTRTRSIPILICGLFVAARSHVLFFLPERSPAPIWRFFKRRLSFSGLPGTTFFPQNPGVLFFPYYRPGLPLSVIPSSQVESHRNARLLLSPQPRVSKPSSNTLVFLPLSPKSI